MKNRFFLTALLCCLSGFLHAQAPRLITEENKRWLPVQGTLVLYPDGNGSYTSNATSAPGVASLLAIANSTATTANNTAVQLGTGNVTATTQRVTLAADGPGVANLQTIATNSAPRATDYGLLPFRSTNLTNTALAVKASSGNVFGLRVINPNANAAFLKFYDLAAASVSVGNSTVAGTIVVPGGSSANPGMVWITPDDAPVFPLFSAAIAVSATANLSDSDNTAPAATLQISVLYK